MAVVSAQQSIGIQRLWPTVCYVFQRPDHAEEAPALIDYLYELRDEQNQQIASRVAPRAKSGDGLFEGDFDLLSRDHASVQKLREHLVRCVRTAVSHVNGGKTPPEQIDVEIPDSWYHITNEGGFHDAHFHNGCSWCGIYYVQLGDAGPATAGGAPNGGSRFYSPLSRGGAYKDFGNKYLDSTYADPPLQDGMLILFPSYLLHSGLPYRGTKDRIVIAFNSRSLLVTG
jgi:uncharacterized protein (TIGR02466 family)